MTDTAAAPQTTSARRELARGGSLSFVGSVVSSAMGLLLIVVLGRALGAAGAGVVLQAVAVFTIALGVARFGMDSAALWILPRALDEHPASVGSTARFLIASSGVVGVLCALVLMAGAHFFAPPDDPVTQAVTATAPFIPLGSMLLTALAVNRGLGKISTYVWVGSIALPSMRPLAVLVAAGLGAGLTGAAVAWALPLAPALLLALVVLAFQLRRSSTGEPFTMRGSGIRASIIRYAVPRAASASLEQLLAWVSVLIVGGIGGAAAAGLFGTASRFVAAGMIIDSAIRVVVSPMFSRLLGRGDDGELLSLYRTATTWLVLFSTPVFLLVAVFSPLVLGLAGDSFSAGEPALMIMCAGSLITLFAGNVHSMLLMSGRSGVAALNKVAALVVNVGLLFALVPTWGIIGAAVAWAAACMLDAALALLEVRGLLGLPITLAPAFRPCAVGLLCVGVPAVLARVLIGADWFGLAAALAVGIPLFFSACRLDRRRLQVDELFASFGVSSLFARVASLFRGRRRRAFALLGVTALAVAVVALVAVLVFGANRGADARDSSEPERSEQASEGASEPPGSSAETPAQIPEEPAKPETPETELSDERAAEIVRQAVEIPIDSSETLEDLDRALAGIAEASYLAELEVRWEELDSQGWTVTGKPVVVSATVTELTPDSDPPRAEVTACIDDSAVRTLDSEKHPIGDASATPRSQHLFTLDQASDGTWRVTAHGFPDDPTC